MTLILLFAGLLHLVFAVLEMFPLHKPFILERVAKKKGIAFAGVKLKLTATIVQNAAIYNLILAVGFFWSALPGAIGPSMAPSSLAAFRSFLLGGAFVAGTFGLTLSPFTLVQALLGVVGLVGMSLG